MGKACLKKNESDMAWRVIDGEVAIIPLASNESQDSMIILNQTATRIWEMVNGKNSTEEIIKKILLEYEVAPKEAKTEVDKIIAYLLRKKLIMPS